MALALLSHDLTIPSKAVEKFIVVIEEVPKASKKSSKKSDKKQDKKKSRSKSSKKPAAPARSSSAASCEMSFSGLTCEMTQTRLSTLGEAPLPSGWAEHYNLVRVS